MQVACACVWYVFVNENDRRQEATATFALGTNAISRTNLNRNLPPGIYSQAFCHEEFAVFWSKQLKYLTKNLFANMKLLLENQEENIKGFFRGEN